MARTEYVVLQAGADGGWHRIGTATSSSARGALHHVASKSAQEGALGLDEDEFVAVPLRSWNPMRVKVSIQTRLQIVQP